jgi:galactose mutarotase-like enzyme
MSTLFTIENEHLKASIKGLGAELCSLIDKKTGSEHVWQADPAIWARHAPVLFPIVGQVENNKYRVGGKEFSLSQHGFARDTEFEVIHQDPTSIQLSIQSTPKTLALYPFFFELILTYTLVVNRLEVQYEVLNKGQEDMYFSIGAHPGFVCPFYAHETFADYFLKFEKKETVKRWMFHKGLLTGAREAYMQEEDTIRLDHAQFEQDAIILSELLSSWVDLKSKNHSKVLRFHFEGFPLLAFWTSPGKNADYLCIEPWFGISDTRGAQKEFKEKEYVQKLSSGGVFRSKYAVQLKNEE